MRRINANPNIQFTSNIYNEALILIEDVCLTMVNTSLIELGMIAPNSYGNDIFDRDIQRETHFDVNELQTFVRINLPKMVLEQRTAYAIIINAISNKSCGLYFLDAPGDTGKTFLISIILATIRSQNNIVLAIASSNSFGRWSNSTFSTEIATKYAVLRRYEEKTPLKTDMRVQLQQDERFAKQLLDVGNGKMERDESPHYQKTL
ncbi:ATP-dependent DNA helicase [Trichonephila clavipes]|nr:ATP-dependent DNA helicase [Trichonephila clavipes]